MKIVLDTNCLLRSVPPKSEHHIILSALQQGRYVLCYSNEILMEYEELLLRFYSQPIAYNVLNFIVNSPYSKQVNPHYKWNLIYTDLDDNKFVDCALNGGANFLVSNDKHFNVLKNIKFPSVQVLDLDTLKKILLV